MSAQPINTAVEDIPGLVDGLRDYFLTGVTRKAEWRKDQLRGIIKMIEEHWQDLVDAVVADLGSHFYESGMLQANLISDCKHTISELDCWMKPKKISNPWSLYPGSTKVVPEPYGVALDFIPYNYPVFLGIGTLIPILAAGNVCMFKPSSNTPACAKLFQEIFPQYLDKDAVKVVCGPSSICDKILENRFDFIFYTGSPSIGKAVMTAAAKHLTPVLLELGGKSPVYIDKDANMLKTCRRLSWGKMWNGGQTCVAPDYVLVHEDVADQFKETMIKVFEEFYGDIKQYNDNIARIINRRHYDRLIRAMETCGGQIVAEGVHDEERLYIGPTLIESPSVDSELMTDEIFGPVLPFIKVSGYEEAVKFINAREKPLACYIFTESDKIRDYFTLNTSSGALMQNDVIFHVSSIHCPFGGVGNSGMGQYHGKAGFASLSHMKPVLTHSTAIDMTIRYPPYTQGHLNLLKPLC